MVNGGAKRGITWVNFSLADRTVALAAETRCHVEHLNRKFVVDGCDGWCCVTRRCRTMGRRAHLQVRCAQSVIDGKRPINNITINTGGMRCLNVRGAQDTIDIINAQR